MTPTVTLTTPWAAPSALRSALQARLTACCGDCRLVIVVEPSHDRPRTGYTLSGPWALRPTEVHHHLVAIFDALVVP